MSSVLKERLSIAFAPPRFIALPLSGVDVSASGVKAVRLSETSHGLILASYSEVRMSPGVYVDGEIENHQAVSEAIYSASKMAGISSANVALPESKSFLFESVVSGSNMSEWRIAIEQRLDELIPIPPQETVFDIVKIRKEEKNDTRVVGVGFADRIVNDTISIFDDAKVSVRSLEGEAFAMARALLPGGNDSTVLIIDIGRTTTKIAIVAGEIPRFSTTIGIGGHALTLAVQKHFGVTESEARKIKAERGIVPSAGNDDYISVMLSTVSAIRDEIRTRLEYWQNKALQSKEYEPVSRCILIGGNASVRGLPEYLEGVLRIPTVTGNVFTNLAPMDTWVPSLNYTESLAYATAIGLALRDRIQSHE